MLCYAVVKHMSFTLRTLNHILLMNVSEFRWSEYKAILVQSMSPCSMGKTIIQATLNLQFPSLSLTKVTVMYVFFLAQSSSVISLMLQYSANYESLPLSPAAVWMEWGYKCLKAQTMLSSHSFEVTAVSRLETYNSHRIQQSWWIPDFSFG